MRLLSFVYFGNYRVLTCYVLTDIKYISRLPIKTKHIQRDYISILTLSFSKLSFPVGPHTLLAVPGVRAGPEQTKAVVKQ